MPVGALMLLWAVYNFPAEKINAGLISLSIVTVFFSSYLRVRLPSTKIHLTVSDALVPLSLIIYGGEVAILLAAFESFFTSLKFRRQGVAIKLRTIFVNVAVAVVTTFLTVLVVRSIFADPVEIVRGAGGGAVYVGLLTVLALTQFIVNSALVSILIARRGGKRVGQVWWNEYCLNALVMFLSGAALAGLAAKAIERLSMFVFAAIVGFFAVVYMTWRRYMADVKETAAKAERAERERAEQAERHIVELRHHIAEQERVGQALRESKERFRQAAFNDALTNLPNRNSFIETLKFRLEKSRHSAEHNFAVLFLDLDRFKTVNESLGHSTGDVLLKHVGERLKKLIGAEDTLARFGGDEFGLVLARVKSADEAISFAQLINHKLSSPFSIGGRQVFVNASVGIALGSAAYQEAEDVLRDADIAMYYAKDHRKNYEVFDQTMHTRAVTLLQIETDLRYAVERGEMRAYYQPIISLDTLRLAGFETLIRWQHPQRGMVSPAEFIPVSEETGLIVPITLWILRESCRQMVEWQSLDPQRGSSLILSVNLSGKHFAHGNLVEDVAKIIDETGIEPRCLKLEITESAVMENAERVIAMLKELKKLGVQLSIDDFGTGYSSLSYLHRFPIDTLKVDRSFVSTMEDGSENGEIVRTILALAKALGMDVVAEGIETIHQLHQLRILGCEYGQGYLFSRPVPIEEAERIVQDRARWQAIMPSSPKLIIPPQASEVTHLRLAK
jgi:diguanylate cyclase (GGDEF)-like protein